MNVIDTEREKYSELWTDVPDYRKHSPGMENVSRFMSIMKPVCCSTLLDIGCGTGAAGLEFQCRHNMDVSWLDITDAGLLNIIPRERFIQEPLWMDWGRKVAWYNKVDYDYGFCCDVMEHIPTEYSMLVIDRILQYCNTTWFQISLVPDNFGATIGQTLHLTVRPFDWWLERLHFSGKVIEARDLCDTALFVVEK